MRRHSTPIRGLSHAPCSFDPVGRFGRMFRNLPAASHSDADLETLAAIMRGEGADEDRKLNDPEPDEDENPNPRLPAGFTYFGQFIDHDLTFDPASSLDRQNDPDALVDFRTPRFDLDSVYGRGTDDQPYLYDHGGPRLLLGHGADLPRNPDGVALIGDPRNNENLNVTQLHSVFLRLHNRMVRAVESRGVSAASVFTEAQRLTRWHYQYAVVHDFLDALSGDGVVADVLREVEYFADGPRRILRPHLLFYQYRNEPFMPVEFSVAAYRLGHSMVRPSYHLNEEQQRYTEAHGGTGIPRAPFRIPIFAMSGPNLNGFRPIPPKSAEQPFSMEIDWRFFFDFGTGGKLPQPSYRIDTSLVEPLFDLRIPKVIDKHEKHISLAERNLFRGRSMALPSGQSVARAMGMEPLAGEDLLLAENFAVAIEDKKLTEQQVKHAEAARKRLEVETPLWYYVLAEAQKLHEGEHLGPVGGRIVAEVFIGILAGDPRSYLRVDPAWTPAREGLVPGGSLAELVKFAIVETRSHGT
jgi:hypothetical protein